MSETNFKRGIILSASIFFLVFVGHTLPALIESGDLVVAILGGFVNPYATGYSTDTICSWLILFFWVLYEKKAHNIRYGWTCLALGIIPGLAVGFALYLIVRNKQLPAIS